MLLPPLHLAKIGLCAALIAAAPSALDASQPFLLLKLDGGFLKWGKPELGQGAAVRYAFVTGEMQFPGARNCPALRPLEPALRRSGVSPAALRDEAAAAFSLWAAAADIRFEETADPRAADILIGAQAVPRGRAFADVLYDRADRRATRPIEGALICFNPGQPWKVGFGGDAGAYDLRYTLAHEIGHAIGLDHPGPRGQLMSYQYGEAFRAPQPGDLAGAVALYGSRTGTATAQRAAPSANQKPDMGLR